MAKGKGSGFLAAFIVAIVSFLVIFFFFTDVADKYFGISFRGKAKEPEKTGIEKITDSYDKAADAVKAATDAISDVIDTVKKTDISSLIGTPSGNK